jgi:hypothetical protein
MPIRPSLAHSYKYYGCLPRQQEVNSMVFEPKYFYYDICW